MAGEKSSGDDAAADDIVSEETPSSGRRVAKATLVKAAAVGAVVLGLAATRLAGVPSVDAERFQSGSGGVVGRQIPPDPQPQSSSTPYGVRPPAQDPAAGCGAPEEAVGGVVVSVEGPCDDVGGA